MQLNNNGRLRIRDLVHTYHTQIHGLLSKNCGQQQYKNGVNKLEEGLEQLHK